MLLRCVDVCAQADDVLKKLIDSNLPKENCMKKIVVMLFALVVAASYTYAESELDADSMAYTQKLAEQGDASSQYVLGYEYSTGESMQQDYAQAKDWYEKSALQGYPDAQFNLGMMYYQGQGIAQDYAQAKDWFEKAAAQGYPEAQFNIGMMYKEGQGVAPDDAQAKDWFEQACDNGDDRGCDAYK